MTKTAKTPRTMRNPFKSGTAEHFFWAHAGYSYGSEGPAKGRARCAESLATAERDGASAGLSFTWAHDDQTDASFRKTRNPYRLWVCCCHNGEGEVVASLCGIDLGREGNPASLPYARVVRAELASEALPD